MKCKERAFEFEYETECIRGTVHEPVTPNGTLVIMHHGFTGTSIDAHFCFVRFARILAQNGITVLRYDFIGSGNSSGEFNQMTFASELAQAEAILNDVIRWPNITEIMLHGFSMGGVIATKLAAKYPHLVAKVLLWSPAGSMPAIVTQIIENQTPLENGNYACQALELSQEFVLEMKTFQPFSEISMYQGPLCLIQGTRDVAVPLEIAEQYRAAYQQPIEIYYFEGADHTYSKLEWIEQLFIQSCAFLIEDKK